MKIVINTCFGGFELSNKALKRLAELEGRECYFFKGGLGSTYTKTEENERNMFTTAFDIPNPNEVIGNDGGNLWAKHHIDNSRDDRTNPLLVQVVEELGDAASGQCADLKVVEVPDGVKWVLDEYDGVETIHEEHRSWS